MIGLTAADPIGQIMNNYKINRILSSGESVKHRFNILVQGLEYLM